nr:hypothetical protein [Candidatus Sigynarchaeota archaeon]
MASINTWRSTLKRQEALTVIEALETRRVFEFHSYAADARETLVYDAASDRFIITRYHAYNPGEPERRTFTWTEMLMELEMHFSFASFGLSPIVEEKIK